MSVKNNDAMFLCTNPTSTGELIFKLHSDGSYSSRKYEDIIWELKVRRAGKNKIYKRLLFVLLVVISLISIFILSIVSTLLKFSQLSTFLLGITLGCTIIYFIELIRTKIIIDPYKIKIKRRDKVL